MILGALILLAALVSGKPVDSVPELLRAAMAATAASDTTRALQLYRKVVAVDPENSDAHCALGRILGQHGAFDEAAQEFRKALQKRPDWAEVHVDLGLTYIADARSNLDWPSAAVEFQTAVDLQPRYPKAWRLLGVAHRETDQVQLSIGDLQRSIQQDPQDPEAYLQLGRSQEEQGNIAAAMGNYRQVLRLRPADAAASVALAKALLNDRENRREAEQLLRSALSHNPDIPEPHVMLGNVLRQLGDSAGAQEQWRLAAYLRAVPQEGLQASHLSNEALSLASRGDLTKARELLDQAVRTKPDYAVAHFNLGLILADSGDLPQAARELGKAISLQPADARFTRSLEKLATADPNAVTMADRAATDSPDAHLVFASRLRERNDFWGEIGELTHCLTLTPQSLPAREELIKAYRLVGQPDRAAMQQKLLAAVQPAGAH